MGLRIAVSLIILASTFVISSGHEQPRCESSKCVRDNSPQIGTVASLTKEWAKHGFPHGPDSPYFFTRIGKNGVSTMTQNGSFELKDSCLYALFMPEAHGPPVHLKFYAANVPAKKNPVYEFVGYPIPGLGKIGTIFIGKLIYHDKSEILMSVIFGLTDSENFILFNVCPQLPNGGSSCYYMVQPHQNPKLSSETEACINQNLKENHFSVKGEVDIDYSKCKGKIPGFV